MSKDKNNEVIKPNSIAEARGSMNKAFLDLLDICLHEVAVDTSSPDRLAYSIDINRYRKNFGLTLSDSAFRKLRMSAKSSLKANSMLTLKFDDEEGHEIDFFVFQAVEYVPSKYCINVLFTEPFKAYLIELLKKRGKKIYYALPDTLQMNSEYSKKFYPILLERVNKSDKDRMTFTANGSLNGELFDTIYSIDKFKEVLSIPASYKTSNVKSMCDMIIDEIEEHTPYHAEVYYNEAWNGSGRAKTTHVCFRMVQKQPDNPIDVDTLGVEAAPGRNDSEAVKPDDLLEVVRATLKTANVEIDDEEIAAIAKDAEKTGLSSEDVTARINDVCSKGNIDSIVGYLRSAMSARYKKPKSKAEATAPDMDLDSWMTQQVRDSIK